MPSFSTHSRRAAGLAAAAIVTVAALSAADVYTRADSARMKQKIDEIVQAERAVHQARALSRTPAAVRTTPVTQREVNAYLRYDLASQVPAGITEPVITIVGQGRLTGKYSAANPPPGRRSFSAHPMAHVDEVVAALRSIGERHQRTPSQVALNWLIAKGTVPIPGAKNRGQAEQNAGALGWALTSDEVAALDVVALDEKRSLANRFWQHG